MIWLIIQCYYLIPDLETPFLNPEEAAHVIPRLCQQVKPRVQKTTMTVFEILSFFFVFYAHKILFRVETYLKLLYL